METEIEFQESGSTTNFKEITTLNFIASAFIIDGNVYGYML